jgi:hypothetical protein
MRYILLLLAIACCCLWTICAAKVAVLSRQTNYLLNEEGSYLGYLSQKLLSPLSGNNEKFSQVKMRTQ